MAEAYTYPKNPNFPFLQVPGTNIPDQVPTDGLPNDVQSGRVPSLDHGFSPVLRSLLLWQVLQLLWISPLQLVSPSSPQFLLASFVDTTLSHSMSFPV